MPFGVLDTTLIDLPANIDGAYLQGLQNRSGFTMADFVRELENRMVAYNDMIDPLSADLIAGYTDRAQLDDATPGAFVVKEKSEYDVSRPQIPEPTAGHMLAIREYDPSTGWTEDGLLELPRATLLKTIDDLLNGLKIRQRYEVLRRLFSDVEVKVDRHTNVNSPGFAGSGSGANAFAATLYPNLRPVEGGFTMYFRTASAALPAALSTAGTRLRKWMPGTGTIYFDLLGTPSAIDMVKALADDPATGFKGFVGTGSALVRMGTNASEALVDPNKYIGVVNGNIRVRQPIEDFDGDYLSLFRTGGQFQSVNPLIWRYDGLKGRQAYLRSRGDFPLGQALVMQKFGINVNNRVGSAAIQIASSGAYTAPLIP